MKKRIFIGFTEISGIYGGLTNILQKNGYPVTFFCRKDHPFQYTQNTDKGPYALYKKFRTLREETTRKNIFKKILYLSAEWLFYWIAFIKATFTHDVFIFAFGQSFLPHEIDLVILKLLKKRVICIIAHGTDARPAFMDGGRIMGHSLQDLANISKSQKRRIAFIEKHATVVVGAPTTSQFLSKKAINTFALGAPVSPVTAEWKNQGEKDAKKDDHTHILHAPSAPAQKGTEIIRSTISALQDEGYKIRYTELINLTNHEVIETIDSCDFVVDQMYSDAPMARLGAEAAFLKKPTIVAGYEFYLDTPHEDTPPSYGCHPDKLREAIVDLITNPQKRDEIGHSAHRFVVKHWSPEAVGKQYIRLIEDDINEDFYFDPRDYKTIYGWGCDYNTLRETYSALVENYGIECLCLNHRPDLLAAINETFLESAPRL